MLNSVFRCDSPKPWQVKTIAAVIGQDNFVGALSRPTGDGKTLVIQGCAYSCRGVSLILTPTITLTSFMLRELKNDDFQVINLDVVKKTEDVNKLRSAFKAICDIPHTRRKRYIIVTTASTKLVRILHQ